MNLQKLLLSFIVNFPIIKEFGGTFDRILAIVLPVNLEDKVISTLSMLETNTFVKGSECLCESTHEYCEAAIPVFVRYNGKVTLNRALSYISHFTNRGKGRLPILITDAPIPDSNVFNIFWDEDARICHYDLHDIVVTEERIEYVKAHIGLVDELSGLEKVLKLASLLSGSEESFLLVDNLCEHAEMLTEYEEIKNLFVDKLQKLVSRKKNQIFKPLKCNEMHSAETYGNVVLFDDEYIYLGGSVFSEVLAEIKMFVPSLVVKEALKETGVLHHNNTGYTTKITVYSVEESPIRIGFYKLKRQSLATKDDGLNYVENRIKGATK